MDKGILEILVVTCLNYARARNPGALVGLLWYLLSQPKAGEDIGRRYVVS